MSRPLAVVQAVKHERDRCAGWVSALIRTLRENVPPSGQSGLRPAYDAIDVLFRDIRSGKRLPAPKVRVRARTVCSYCDGEEEPENHNRATCPRRFKDIASGKVAA